MTKPSTPPPDTKEVLALWQIVTGRALTADLRARFLASEDAHELARMVRTYGSPQIRSAAYWSASREPLGVRRLLLADWVRSVKVTLAKIDANEEWLRRYNPPKPHSDYPSQDDVWDLIPPTTRYDEDT